MKKAERDTEIDTLKRQIFQLKTDKMSLFVKYIKALRRIESMKALMDTVHIDWSEIGGEEKGVYMYNESSENRTERDEQPAETDNRDSDSAVVKDILDFDEESGYFIKGASAASSIC